MVLPPAPRERRRRYALVALAMAAAGLAVDALTTRTPRGDYWWPVLVVPLAIPLLAVLTAPTAAGRAVVLAGAAIETPLVLLFASYGGMVEFPAVFALWVAAVVPRG